MSVVQRVVKNAAALYIAQIAVTLLGLVLTIFMARELGSANFGKFSFAAGFTAIFAVFLNLGLDTLMVREIARDKSLASKYMGNIFIIKAVLAVIVFVSIVLVLKLIKYPADTSMAVLIFGVSIVFTGFSFIFLQTIQAFERMEYNALISVASQIVLVSLGLSALFLGYGLIGVVSAFAISSLFRLILSFLICRQKFAGPKVETDFKFWKIIGKRALPLGVIPLAAIITQRADIVMLSGFKGDSAVGWYNAAVNIPLGFAQVPWLLMVALLPMMSASFMNSRDTLIFIFEKSSKFLLILALPMAVGMFLLSDRIILVLLGNEYYPSISALQILSWKLLLNFLGTPMSSALISMNKERQVAIISGLSAVINITLNLILIPPFSYTGAAAASITTQFITFLIYYYFTSNNLKRLPLHKLALKPAVACVAMVIFVKLAASLNMFLIIGLAAVIYFLTLWALKPFDRDDIRLLKEIIRVPNALKARVGNSKNSNGPKG
ncbi:MAG: flippase [Dehalococcoidia bacterium]|nr:flippase [Dehalococcoidia bacterium]